MADPIETAIYRMGVDNTQYVAGMAQAGESTSKFAALIDKSEVAQERMTKATRNTEQSVARLHASLDPAVRRLQDYERAVEKTNRLRADGLIDEQRQAELQRLAQLRFDQQTAAANRLNVALTGTATAAKLSHTEQAILRAGLINTVQTLAAGGNAAQTLQTQFFQTLPALSGVVRAYGSIAVAAGAAAAGVAALAAPLALGLARAADLASEAREFSNVLRATGNEATTTTGRLHEMVEGMRDLGVAKDDARAALTAALRIPGSTIDDIRRASTMAADFSAAFGVSAQEATKHLVKMSTDGLNGIQALDKQFNILNPTQLATIRNFIEMGDKAAAMRVATDALSARIGGAAVASMSEFERATLAVGREWSNLITKISESGPVVAIVDKLAEALRKTREGATPAESLSQELDRYEARLRSLDLVRERAARRFGPGGDAAVGRVDAEIAEVRAQLADAQRRLALTGAVGMQASAADYGGPQNSDPRYTPQGKAMVDAATAALREQQQIMRAEPEIRDAVRAKIQAYNEALRAGALETEANAYATLKYQEALTRLTPKVKEAADGSKIAAAMTRGWGEDMAYLNNVMHDAERIAADKGRIRNLEDQATLAREELRLQGATTAERAAALTILQAELDLKRRNVDLTSEQAQAEMRITREIAATRAQMQRATEEQSLFLEPLKNAARGIQDAFAGAFESIFEGGIRTFGDLASAIRSVMVRTAAQIAAMLVFRPVLGGIAGSLGIGGGTAAAGQSGGINMMDALSGAKSIGEMVVGGPSAIGTAFTAASVLPSAIAGGATATGVAVPAAAAVMGGDMIVGSLAATAGPLAGMSGSMAAVGAALAAAAPYLAVAAVALPLIMSLFNKSTPSVGPNLISSLALTGTPWGAASNPSQQVTGRYFQGYAAMDNGSPEMQEAVRIQTQAFVDTIDGFIEQFGIRLTEKASDPAIYNDLVATISNFLAPKEGNAGDRVKGFQTEIAGILSQKGLSSLTDATADVIRQVLIRGFELGALDAEEPIRRAVARSTATTMEQLIADVAAPGAFMQSLRDVVTGAGPNGQAILQVRGLADQLRANIAQADAYGFGAEGAAAALDTFRAQLDPVVKSLDIAKLDQVFDSVGRGMPELLTAFGEIAAQMKDAAAAQAEASAVRFSTETLMLDVANKLNTAAVGLLEYQQSLLTGPLSALSPGAQFGETERQFRALLPAVWNAQELAGGAIMPGGVSQGADVEAIKAAVPGFLAAAQAYYGGTSTSGYAQAYQLAQAGLTAGGVSIRQVGRTDQSEFGYVPIGNLLMTQSSDAARRGLNVPGFSGPDLAAILAEQTTTNAELRRLNGAVDALRAERSSDSMLERVAAGTKEQAA